MTTFKQAFNLFKIICKDSFQSGLKKLGKKSNNEKNETFDINNRQKNNVAGKVLLGIAIALGIIGILFYMAVYSGMMTEASIASGLYEEVLYTYIAMAQLIVLFFGSIALLNYLYFSKDNQLLASLPVSSKSIFLAKYGMTYLAELLISALFCVPLFVSYGLVLSYNGIAITAWYYVLIALATLLMPIIPLFVASIICIPLMYFVSFMKKRAFGNALVIAFITLAVLTIYLLFVSGMSSMASNTDEEGALLLSSSMAQVFIAIKKYTIFNYPLVNSFLNNNSALNFVIYIGGILVLSVIATMISSAFYSKGMRVIIEGNNGSSKKTSKTPIDYDSTDFKKSFIKKEIKNLLNTPTLLIGVLMGIVIIPIFAFIFGKAYNISGDDSLMGNDFYLLGLIMYMASIMAASGNTISLVGISMEGKNLYLLKSLPITITDILKPKLIVSGAINLLIALTTAVSILIISSSHNVIVAILIVAVLLLGGIGTSSNGLYTDLKKPNLNYKNITELTKNNTRTIKPVLINVGIGFAYMIMGVVLGLVSDEQIAPLLKYVMFFGVAFLADGLFAGISWKKLNDNAEEKYENIEV
jgi:ABC-2 type transport system permease protein